MNGFAGGQCAFHETWTPMRTWRVGGVPALGMRPQLRFAACNDPNLPAVADFSWQNGGSEHPT